MKAKTSWISRCSSLLPEEKRTTYLLALLSSFLVTLLGMVYFAATVCFALGGQMTYPPGDSIQLFGGITTALAALLMPVFFVSMHYMAPVKAKVCTLLAVVFCVLFSAFTGINRFVQLSIVRLSLLEGNTVGLERFLPYDGRSAMFALEMIGLSLFMSLALLFLALSMGRKKLTGAARATFLAYVPLGLVSAVAFLLDSPLSIIGFAAWGFVLFVGTGLTFLSLIKHDRHWAAGGAINTKG